MTTPKKKKVAQVAPTEAPAVPAPTTPPTLVEKLEVLHALVVDRLIERLGAGQKVIATDLTNAVALLRKAGVVLPDAPAAPELPGGSKGWSALDTKEKAELGSAFTMTDLPFPGMG